MFKSIFAHRSTQAMSINSSRVASFEFWKTVVFNPATVSLAVVWFIGKPKKTEAKPWYAMPACTCS